MMTKEPFMGDCAHCGQSAHDSRACNNGKVGSLKLFGVRIDPKSHQLHGKEKGDDRHGSVNCIGNLIRKCKSMESLEACNIDPSSIDRGYQSDGPPDRSHNAYNKTKGVPWTEDEHMSFLIGLEKLGKGDWRGISKNYVPSRTPTQVASHAQKYFIRVNTTREKIKRRSSLFDMPFQESHMVPRAPVPISLRPPVSPLARTYEIQDFNYRSRMIGYTSSRYKQKFGDPKCPLALPFVPMASYPNQDR
ncbi:Homeodomain-like protein, partial [Cynara cardunculus var. scolymus]